MAGTSSPVLSRPQGGPSSLPSAGHPQRRQQELPRERSLSASRRAQLNRAAPAQQPTARAGTTPPLLCHRHPQALEDQAEWPCSPAASGQAPHDPPSWSRPMGIRRANDRAGPLSSCPSREDLFLSSPSTSHQPRASAVLPQAQCRCFFLSFSLGKVQPPGCVFQGRWPLARTG